MQRSLAAVILLIAAFAVAGGGWIASVAGDPAVSGKQGSVGQGGAAGAALAVAVSGLISTHDGDDTRILGQGELPPVARVDYSAFPAVRVPSPSTGRTWYVATTGDDQATGAPDRALRTIEAALRQAGNGDIVYVRGGTYATTGVVVTQSDFLLSAYPGESVTIEPAEASSTYGLTIAAPGRHDVTVRGLRLQGFADVGIYLGNPVTVRRVALEDLAVSGSDTGFAGDFQQGTVAVDGLLVRRMTLSDMRDVGFEFGAAAGRNVRITGLHVQIARADAAAAIAPSAAGSTTTGAVGTSAATGAAGTALAAGSAAGAPPFGGDGLAFAAGDNVLIENTIVEGATADGIDLKATRVAVVNSVVRRVGGSGIKLGAGGDVINCIVSDTGGDAQLVTGAQSVADAQLVTEGGSYRIIDCTIAGRLDRRGNPAYRGGSYAATFGYPGSVGDVALINSAFFEQSGALFFSAAMKVQVQQCDFWGFPDRLVEWGARSWDAAALARPSAAEIGPGNITVDPGFVDPEGGDFHPGPGSPLFGAGTAAAGIPTFDLILEARDSVGHTIGAYQTTVPSRLSFVDVPFDHPYREAIVALAGSRVVSGYWAGDGSILFKPDDPVRRAQFAKMVSGVLRLPVNESLVASFTDLGPDDPKNLYPHNYVAAAVLAGITRGVVAGEFAPWADITRAQVVTMLVRGTEQVAPNALADPPTVYLGTMGDFSVDHGPAMRTAEYNGLLAGIVGFGRGWSPWQAATRGEVAHMLHVLAGKL